MITNTITTCFLLFIFIGCSTLNRNDIIEQTSIIENCRKNWEYKSIDGMIELEILKYRKKSHRTMISHPSFFIGKTVQNDTIGIIEYYTERDWKKGDRVKFIKDKYEEDISDIKTNMSNKPIFYVSTKRNKKDLQCSITTIYYGKVFEE